MNKKILSWIKPYTHLILTLIFLSLNISAAEPININTASKESIIANLNGIGTAKADAIIAFREKNGDFIKAEDLLQVSGIGEKLLSKFKDDLLFEISDKATLESDKSSVTPIDQKVQKKISKKQQKAIDAKGE